MKYYVKSFHVMRTSDKQSLSADAIVNELNTQANEIENLHELLRNIQYQIRSVPHYPELCLVDDAIVKVLDDD